MTDTRFDGRRGAGGLDADRGWGMAAAAQAEGGAAALGLAASAGSMLIRFALYADACGTGAREGRRTMGGVAGRQRRASRCFSEGDRPAAVRVESDQHGTGSVDEERRSRAGHPALANHAGGRDGRGTGDATVAVSAGASRSSDDDPSSADLVAMARGDEAAFRALYERLVGRVWSVVLRVVGDPAAAEEIVADVFFEVWSQADRFDPNRGRAEHWVLLRARSRAIDHLRRERRWRENLQSVAGDVEAPGDIEGLEPSVPGVDDATLTGWAGAPAHPDVELERLQRACLLDRAMAALDDSTRFLIEKAFYEGWTHAELQLWTGLPLGTLKSRIRRGLQRLRSWVDGPVDDVTPPRARDAAEGRGAE